jgi:YhcH/YjgK/YiaL family protein
MLATTIRIAEKYNYLTERFQDAYQFLRTTDFSAFDEPCEIEIDGRDVYAQVQIYDSKSVEECRFEAHRAYIDNQYVAEGEEYLGFITLGELEEDTEYDPDLDLIFFKTPLRYGRILLRKGDFAVVSPDDGHMPRCISDHPRMIKKVVVKVRV